MKAHAGGRKVSVIIPTYNRSRYIKTSLVSALRQTYRNIEVIVIDDGSTDGTCETLRPYVEDGSITYIRRENSGRPSIARNQALKSASGEYICFLDSDDVRREDSIERAAAVLDRHKNVGMVCSDWLVFKRHFKARRERKQSWITIENYLDALPAGFIERRGDDFVILGKDFIYEIFSTNFVFTSSVLVRRGLLDQVGNFDESLTIGEDCDLWLRINELKRTAFITRPLVYRRQHPGSITRHVARNILDDTRVLEKFMSGRRKPLPYVKERFYRRLEKFYYESGYFFFVRDNLAEARKRFLRSIRYNPYYYWHYRYFMISLLPLGALRLARKVKNWIRPSKGPADACGGAP